MEQKSALPEWHSSSGTEDCHEIDNYAVFLLEGIYFLFHFGKCVCECVCVCQGKRGTEREDDVGVCVAAILNPTISYPPKFDVKYID